MNTPILRRRACAICLHNNHLLTITLRDPHTSEEFISVPGGGIEGSETGAEAAVRETFEETGYRVVASGQPERTTRYLFTWGSTAYDCITTWVYCSLVSELASPVRDEEDVISAGWLPVSELAANLVDHDHIRKVILDLVAEA